MHSRARNCSNIRPIAQLFSSRAAFALGGGILAFVLAGCGSSVTEGTPTQPPTTYSGVTFGGKAMAGKLPLIGASLQLYTAGASGNGSAGTALLSTALTTDANGAFTVPAGYVCPTGTTQIYVVARGGKPGAAATSANAAITLLTPLGACNQVVAASQIVVNEVTTVAATYALSQFLSAGANLGASSTNGVGLQNAVATASALANINAGTSPGASFAPNGSSPAPTIDSLANLLNACTAGSGCSALFSATTLTGGSAPTNTLDAALSLVRHPTANVASLFASSSAASAFSPALTAAPADWALYVDYSGGGMVGPSSIGLDSTGNIWVADYYNVASVFSPLGKPLLPQGITGFGLSASYGLAVDANNHAWITNEPSTGIHGNSITVLDSTPTSYAGSGGFTGAGLNYPIAVAIDTDGSAWIVDYGDSSLTHLSSSGQALSGASGYTSASLAFPVAAAIDSSHNVWVANQGGGTVSRVAPDGSQFTTYTCCNGPSNLAIDQLGNVWVTNYYGDSLSEISKAGVVLASGTYAGGGIDHPQGIAIDGTGNVWIANYRNAAISELAGASLAGVAPGTTLSPTAGIGPHAALNESYSIAVDASGNLWVSNFGSNTITEFIGMAAPVRTPLIGLPAAP